MPLISLELLNGTPVFATNTVTAEFARVYGNQLDPDKRRWLFPAYPPFGNFAVRDLKIVAPKASYTPEALKHIAELEALPQHLKNRTLPSGFSFATKPFDHQIEGLAYLCHHPRFALYWEAGTGKTKVLVDLLRAFPGKRALVFTPKITVRNWLKEVEFHSGGTLKAGAFTGSPEQKRKLLSRYKEYDVLVGSYGTARNYGFPRIHEETMAAVKGAVQAGATLSESGGATLLRGVRLLSDPDRQQELVLAWALGTPIAQVVRFAQQEAATSPQWLIDLNYDIIIADESHNLNNYKAQQTKATVALAKKAGRRYLMSGTPTLGDPRHLYSQMKFLSPSIIPENWKDFSEFYLVFAPYNKHMVVAYKNLNVLNERIQRVAIFKTKEECLDLPPRSVIDVPVELDDAQVDMYNALVTTMTSALESFFALPDGDAGRHIIAQNAAVLLNKLAQVTSGFVIDTKKDTEICNTCGALARCVEENIKPYTSSCAVVQKAPPGSVHYFKANPKLEMLETLLDSIFQNPKAKCIVWGLYTAELDAIEKLLGKKKLPYVRMDGSTGGNLQERIDTFNNDEKYRVYLGQVATGIGVTLNSATYMIYYSLPWSLGHYLQSIDRNYRAGQTQKTIVFRLLGERTVDKFKALALDQKKDISRMLTKKISCAICEKQTYCMQNGVEVFDPKCTFKRGVVRAVAEVETI